MPRLFMFLLVIFCVSCVSRICMQKDTEKPYEEVVFENYRDSWEVWIQNPGGSVLSGVDLFVSRDKVLWAILPWNKCHIDGETLCFYHCTKGIDLCRYSFVKVVPSGVAKIWFVSGA